MSLLMDALKKAELAKRKTQPDSAPPSAPPAAPVASSAPDSRAATDSPQIEYRAAAAGGGADASPTRLPTLPEHLELLDEEFVAKAPTAKAAAPAPGAIGTAPASSAFSLQELDIPSPSVQSAPKLAAETTATSAAADQERDAVQNLFETKQAAPSRKMFAIAVGVATLCAVAAIGLYFWSELQPKSGLQVAGSMPATPPAKPLTPLAEAPAQPSPQAAIPGLPLAGDTPSQTSKEAPLPEPEEPAVAKAASFQDKKLFRVTSAAPLANQNLDRAYAALTRGDNATAKAAYEQVLTGDPKNSDALAGLAVVAQKSGNAELAADYYLQILDADPKNATAMAGLINLQSRMDPGVAETRIKQALANQPDSAALNFSLGNLYARGKRWIDAQQTYFKAVTGDPSNPDYLFNLAISLDQLHQPKLAAKYYDEALAAAETRPAAFDKAQAAERIQKLQLQP